MHRPLKRANKFLFTMVSNYTFIQPRKCQLIIYYLRFLKLCSRLQRVTPASQGPHSCVLPVPSLPPFKIKPFASLFRERECFCHSRELSYSNPILDYEIRDCRLFFSSNKSWKMGPFGALIWGAETLNKSPLHSRLDII